MSRRHPSPATRMPELSCARFTCALIRTCRGIVASPQCAGRPPRRIRRYVFLKQGSALHNFFPASSTRCSSRARCRTVPRLTTRIRPVLSSRSAFVFAKRYVRSRPWIRACQAGRSSRCGTPIHRGPSGHALLGQRRPLITLPSFICPREPKERSTAVWSSHPYRAEIRPARDTATGRQHVGNLISFWALRCDPQHRCKLGGGRDGLPYPPVECCQQGPLRPTIFQRGQCGAAERRLRPEGPRARGVFCFRLEEKIRTLGGQQIRAAHPSICAANDRDSAPVVIFRLRLSLPRILGLRARRNARAPRPSLLPVTGSVNHFDSESGTFRLLCMTPAHQAAPTLVKKTCQGPVTAASAMKEGRRPLYGPAQFNR